jgi:very-short-patch-repair endonuclease
VVSVEQLDALGLDRYSVRRRAAAGWLHRLHRGVYAVGHASLSKRSRYMAAVLACGPGSALSHRAAGELWSLRPSSGPPEVTIPRGRAGPGGVRVHRSRTTLVGDVTRVDQIPVTTVARTLLDLAAIVPSRDLARAVDRAERLELFDLAAVEEVLLRSNGRRGAAALRRSVGSWEAAATRSELEDRFRELVRSSDRPQPLFNVLVDGERRTHEVDAFWPAHGLVVQLDGFAYHRTRRDHERDASATADLELAGYRVMRLTWGDVTLHARRTLRRLPV